MCPTLIGRYGHDASMNIAPCTYLVHIAQLLDHDLLRTLGEETITTRTSYPFHRTVMCSAECKPMALPSPAQAPLKEQSQLLSYSICFTMIVTDDIDPCPRHIIFTCCSINIQDPV